MRGIMFALLLISYWILPFTHASELRIEKTITQADGLASDTVLTIFEDSQGVMWFGTTNGVTRYIQEDSKTFTMEDGLASDAVGLIFEDQQGALWFAGSRGYWSGGISRYYQDAFQTFTTTDGLANSSVRDIFQDNTGTLWFATGWGVSRYDGQKFNNFVFDGPMGMNILPEWWNDVRAIAHDTAGNFWFATDAAISYYNVQNSRFRYFGVDKDFTPFQEMGNTPTGHMTDLLFDVNGNLWISQEPSWSEHCGIRRYDGNKLTTFPRSQDMPMNGVGNITQDSKGNIWFAGGKKLPPILPDTGASTNSVPHDAGPGVSVFNGESFQNFNVANGMPSSQVQSVFEASDGKLWFATDAGAAVGVYLPSQESPVLLDPVVIPNPRGQNRQ